MNPKMSFERESEDDTFDGLTDTFEDEQTDFQKEIVIKEVSKQRFAVKILKFLMNNEVAYTDEIAKGTGIKGTTVSGNMRKLLRGNVVERIVYYNRSKKYYRLNPDFPVEEIIKRFNRHIGMKLYKHVPLNQTITDEELKKNPKFKSDCRYYGITIDEGIELVKNNTRKIETEPIKEYPYTGVKGYRFRRKEQ